MYSVGAQDPILVDDANSILDSIVYKCNNTCFSIGRYNYSFDKQCSHSSFVMAARELNKLAHGFSQSLNYNIKVNDKSLAHARN